MPFIRDFDYYIPTRPRAKPRVIKTTTINPFWNDWSATKPTIVYDTQIDNNNLLSTTDSNNNKKTENIIFHDRDEYYSQSQKSTQKTTTEQMLPWLEEILREHTTSLKPPTKLNATNEKNKNDIHVQTTTERLLPWMQDILNEYTITSTIRSTTIDSNTPNQIQLIRSNTRKNSNFGSGDNSNNGGGNISFDGLLFFNTNDRYSFIRLYK